MRQLEMEHGMQPGPVDTKPGLHWVHWQTHKTFVAKAQSGIIQAPSNLKESSVDFFF